MQDLSPCTPCPVMSCSAGTDGRELSLCDAQLSCREMGEDLQASLTMTASLQCQGSLQLDSWLCNLHLSHSERYDTKKKSHIRNERPNMSTSISDQA